MNEDTPMSWVWMAVPLIGLAINLVWPRDRGLKFFGLVVLVLAARLHGFLGPNPLARSVAFAERALTGQTNAGPQEIVAMLRWGRASAEQTIFDISLGLTLGMVFAIMPAGILFRLYSRLATRQVPIHSDDNKVSVDTRNA